MSEMQLEHYFRFRVPTVISSKKKAVKVSSLMNKTFMDAMKEAIDDLKNENAVQATSMKKLVDSHQILDLNGNPYSKEMVVKSFPFSLTMTRNGNAMIMDLVFAKEHDGG